MEQRFRLLARAGLDLIRNRPEALPIQPRRAGQFLSKRSSDGSGAVGTHLRPQLRIGERPGRVVIKQERQTPGYLIQAID